MKSVLVLLLLIMSCAAERSQSSLYQDESISSKVKEAYSTILDRYEAIVEGFDTQSAELRITTINVGMLSTIVVSVPEYARRSAVLAKNLERHVEETGTNVFFFQELWHADDRQNVLDFADEAGFVAVLDDAAASGHGLNILVHRDLIGGTDLVGNRFERLGTQFFKQKGVLVTHLELPSGQTVSLINAHLSFGFSERENAARLGQVSRVADEISRADSGGDETFIEPSDFYVFGGDFNLSPEMENPLEDQAAGWERNKLGYVELFRLAESVRMIDSFLVKNQGLPGYTQDRNANPLTAVSSSTKTEPEQRLDYILVGSSKGIFRIAESRLVFSEAIVDDSDTPMSMEGGEPLLLSDHMGVFSVLELSR